MNYQRPRPERSLEPQQKADLLREYVAEKCRNNLRQKLPPAVHPGLSLDVVLCEWGELHNRFVLTDRGGFQFGHGLSSADGGRDHVNILSEAQWREEWEKHREREVLYNLGDAAKLRSCVRRSRGVGAIDFE